MFGFRKLAIAALAVATLSVLLIASALAASKVFEERVQNEPLVVPAVNLCSPSDDFVGTESHHVTVWDNDRVVAHFSLSGKVVDSATGEKIGSLKQVETDTNGPGGLPMTTQFNFKVTCEGTGQVVNDHFGLTVDKNGNVHIHHP
jgi:hypothetical protein